MLLLLRQLFPRLTRTFLVGLRLANLADCAFDRRVGGVENPSRLLASLGDYLLASRPQGLSILLVMGESLVELLLFPFDVETLVLPITSVTGDIE